MSTSILPPPPTATSPAPVAVVAPQPPAVPALKPMGLRSAVFYFGGPALLFVFAIWALRPVLESAGIPGPESTTWAVGSMAAVLLVIAFAAYRLEGNPWRWDAFRTRYRLYSISPRGWLWTLGALVFSLVTVLGLDLFRDQAMARLGIQLPATSYTANVLGFTIMMVFVTLGEDLWWRGYVLPRQELAHGRWAWFVHGTGWTLFHIATWWELPTMWLGALAMSFVAQRLKNTTPAMVVHFAFNFISIMFLVLALSA
jgi:membrane protease YdiL (CAAX protease family)